MGKRNISKGGRPAVCRESDRLETKRIKRYLFPKVGEQVQKYIDKESIKNIYQLSLAVAAFEALTLGYFTVTRAPFSRESWISAFSVLFCIAVCITAHVCAWRILKKKEFFGRRATLLNVSCYLILSVWAVLISWRDYTRGDHLFTFFTVELIMVCFIPLRPWISVLMTGGVYLLLYGMLYWVDGAARINQLNYFVLALVSMAGMVVRYHSQIRNCERAVRLKKSNEMLEYATRHDGLTGLRNRRALDEDVIDLVGKTMSVFMIDIDYFKEINDTYGHTAGDRVLKETARRIKALFPDNRIYRYGGDEFLVMGEQEQLYTEDTCSFQVPAVSKDRIGLSIGYARGDVGDYDQLFKLISTADAGLYRVKRKTHSPENGGHERRHGMAVRQQAAGCSFSQSVRRIP